ncbi:DDE-type integrase/transposase/recombinase, partial [Streptomyces noursei]|uniref:DDE-type integrase/transposase/recombinase n=1 Tax=Streptomyces noursei TaxID=1971 RepID=UPI0011AF9B7B
VRRDFSARQLNEKWCGDITYVQVGGTWLYLACVLDICSRRVLGYSMATHMRAGLVIDALGMAVAARGRNVNSVIFHADRGAQYTSDAFAQVCDGYGIRRSMGRVGSSYEVSRRREFHPPPLSEPCVNLATHTAPIVEPVGRAPCFQ